MIQHHQISVRMGEICIGRPGDRLVTVLGSCVGVLLVDRERKTAGLAHIQLPSSSSATIGPSDPPGKYADVAVAELVQRLGASNRLVAHLAGGADMFETSRALTVGQLNIRATQQLINERNIPIASKDFGGTLARRLSFDVGCCNLLVETVKTNVEEVG